MNYLKKDLEELKLTSDRLIKNKLIMNSYKITIEQLSNKLKNGGKLFFIGNGGSAAECQHQAAEYTSLLNIKNYREPIPAISLTTDTSFLTAYSNDFKYDDIFTRQIISLCSKKDILFAYSTSGNSKNIINGVRAALKKHMLVIIFTNKLGGALNKLFQKNCIFFKVPSNNTARVQECHTLIGHAICKGVEKIYDKNKYK